MEYYFLTPLLFLLRIIEVFSQFALTLIISNSKVKIRNLFGAAVLFTVLFESTKLYIPHYLSSFVSLILCILVTIFILKITYKKAILSYLITMWIVGIVDCIVSLSILKICNLSTFSELAQSEMLSSLGKVAIILVLLFISAIIKLIYQQKNSNTVVAIKSSTNLLTLIVTFFLLAPNFTMILYYHDRKTLPLAIIIINIIAIIATLIINVFNTQRGIKLVQAEEELITEKTYNHTLQELVDSLRTFKHDYNNTLQTIHGYIFTEDMQGLKTFFNQILAESKTITALDRLNPELFRNPSLFGLVTAKFEYARKKDVTVNFEIYADLNNIDIKTYDFTRTLGIFLDNAIEASAGSEKKIVNFYVVERNNKVTIEISNSFSNTELKIDDINKKGVSSKGENRGLGLYKVKDILSRYPKIKHETTATNGMFLQRLVIDKIKLPVS